MINPVGPSTPTGFTGHGLIVRKSPYVVRETVARLERAATLAGAQLFGRIDHAATAKRSGLALEPTELVMFGRPDTHTQWIGERRSAGVDLPLKILVWRQGTEVWLAYNDIGYLAMRHGVTSDAVASMEHWLEAVVQAATRT
jgi:uncharacterized protein (DUF302 family)